MKHRDHLRMRSVLLVCCLAAFPAVHAADTSTSTSTTTTTTATTSTAVGTSATTKTKLSAEFASFLGGETQARAVVSGLRQGAAFSLDPATTTAGTSTATIDPPTGTMGYGNVRITLRLAQAELSQLGITQPTTEELSAVLLGGTLNGTPLDGILALRADGMGWGQIARKYGMTVGHIMGKGGGMTKNTATASTQSGTAGKTRATAGSTAGTAHASQSRANGYIPSGKASDAGIVSGAGSSVGAAADDGAKGQTHKPIARIQNAGMVSAGGQQVSMSGVSNAGSEGKALAPGQSKKD